MPANPNKRLDENVKIGLGTIVVGVRVYFTLVIVFDVWVIDENASDDCVVLDVVDGMHVPIALVARHYTLCNLEISSVDRKLEVQPKILSLIHLLFERPIIGPKNRPPWRVLGTMRPGGTSSSGPTIEM